MAIIWIPPLGKDSSAQSASSGEGSGGRALDLHLYRKQRLGKDKLKSAYKCLTNKLLKDIPTTCAGLKKADVVLAIKLHLEMYRPPAENIVEPLVPDADPVVKAFEKVPEQLAPPPIVVEEPEDPVEPPAVMVVEEPVETGRSRRGIKRPAKFCD